MPYVCMSVTRPLFSPSLIRRYVLVPGCSCLSIETLERLSKLGCISLSLLYPIKNLEMVTYDADSMIANWPGILK